MRHDFLDRFTSLDSPIHRLPATIKLPCALGIIITTVVVPFHAPWMFAVPAGILAAIIAWSRIPWRYIGTRLLFLEPFAFGVALMTLLQHDGIHLFLAIVAKSTLSLVTIILLSNTMPFSDTLSFFRKIGIPALLVTVLTLTYRYLFVLIDETVRLRRARDSRTFAAGRARIWVSLSSLVGQLFIRSTERSERIYAAMISRGWK